MNVIVFAFRLNDIGRCISRNASSVFVDAHYHANALRRDIRRGRFEDVVGAGAQILWRRRERRRFLNEVDGVARIHAFAWGQIGFVLGVGRIWRDQSFWQFNIIQLALERVQLFGFL